MRTLKKDESSYRNVEIESYDFQDLGEVAESKVRNFNFGEINPGKIREEKIDQGEIRPREEYQASQGSSFFIDPIVREQRGLDAKLEEDIRTVVATRVKKTLAERKDQGFDEGYEVGLERARDEIEQEKNLQVQELVEKLNCFFDEIVDTKKEILDSFGERVNQICETISKWVLLREMDIEYPQRLMEKLIHEVDTLKSITIKLDPETFKKRFEILELIQNQTGELKNVRFVENNKTNYPGVIVETPSEILDGSLEEQFKHIDRIFESIDDSSR